MTVAVALCHIAADRRTSCGTGSTRGRGRRWNPTVPEVAYVGTVRSRILAREVAARLTRAAKMAATRPAS